MTEDTLSDYGERRIIREIIPRYVRGSGNDCAIIENVRGSLVFTTDPVPPPAASLIGNDDDLYWMGWLLVTINASDIAASGAKPMSFVAALDLPGELKISELERLLSGICASCEANSLRYVGGNLRESERIRAVGSAIGVSERPPLTRQGAEAGDLVVVIGAGGRFWGDAERIRVGMAVEKSSSPVFSPVSQAVPMYALQSSGLIKCAMDTSDGLAPALVEMSLANNLGIDVDVCKLKGNEDIARLVERPERLWFGWGDWTVVACVRQNQLGDVERCLGEVGSDYTVIGEFCGESSGVWLLNRGARVEMPRLESERFAADSWFSLGIGEYRRRLLDLKMP